MGVLSKSYNPAAYNALGEIQVVSKMVSRDAIKALGPIFLKYGLEKRVAVIIAHRHFDLKTNEVMLEFAVGDADSVKEGKEVGRAVSIANPVPLDEAERQKAVPNVMALFDGKWCPVNFEPADSKASDLTTTAELSPWENSAFLDEVRQYLESNGLADKLMLGYRRNRNNDNVRCDDPAKDKAAEIKKLLVEYNDNATRTSTIRLVDSLDQFKDDEPCIETTYGFHRRQTASDGIANSDEGSNVAECDMVCWVHCLSHETIAAADECDMVCWFHCRSHSSSNAADHQNVTAGHDGNVGNRQSSGQEDRTAALNTTNAHPADELDTLMDFITPTGEVPPLY